MGKAYVDQDKRQQYIADHLLNKIKAADIKPLFDMLTGLEIDVDGKENGLSR